MLRIVLLVLTLGLLKNDVECGTLGKISKSNKSLLPRAGRELPSQWTKLHSEFPPGSKVLVNTTSRSEGAGNRTTSKRQAKFLPKFSIVAGVDIDGALASRLTANVTPLTKLSQATRIPNTLKPYFAASYDPYPALSSVQEAMLALYNVVERLSLQMDNFNKHTNNSLLSLTSENINADMLDDRKRRKDKLKKKKATPDRKQQQKVREEEENEQEEIDDVDEKDSQKLEKFEKVKDGSKNDERNNPNTRQAQSTNRTNNTAANSTNTTEHSNVTYSLIPGYYYGGNPQSIGPVSFTYDGPQESYGSPYSNYGPPSTSYGAPSYSHGHPLRGYGPPSQSYETAHYSAFPNHEPIVYEDPGEVSFGSVPSERWQQRLPFARSRDVGTTTHVPAVNSNGFVPIL